MKRRTPSNSSMSVEAPTAVGLLAIGRTDRQPSPPTLIVRSALAALGWIDGQNFRLAVREGTGHVESVMPLIDELVRMPADVLVVSGGTVVSRLVPATRTIPIVMAASAIDPVRAGMGGELREARQQRDRAHASQ